MAASERYDRRSGANRRKPTRVPLAAVAGRLVDPQPPPERAAELAFLREAVGRVLGGLTAERHRVLALTMGLPDPCGIDRAGSSYTADEIGRILKISRERVCAVRAVALARLRDNRDSRRLLLPFADDLFGEG